MITPGHIYSCEWKNEPGTTFYNVITSVTSTHVIGYCEFESYESLNLQKSEDSYEGDWEIGNFSLTNTAHNITDLGTFDQFRTNYPEYFV